MSVSFSKPSCNKVMGQLRVEKPQRVDATTPQVVETIPVVVQTIPKKVSVPHQWVPQSAKEQVVDATTPQVVETNH